MWFVEWYKGFRLCSKKFETMEEAYAYFCWIEGVEGVRSPIYGRNVG